jgi:RHS repeat-associated protein
VRFVPWPSGRQRTWKLSSPECPESVPAGTDPGGVSPRLGLGPNTQLTYGDAANPLRPTQEIDGNGTVTLMAYDLHGQMTSRIEAFGTALERETTWEYDAVFPAFVTEVVRPSVTGNPLDERRTSTIYDAEGDATSRTIAGFEDGSTFSLATTMTYNAAGQPTSIDPPGFGTADVTSFTYDPSHGDVVALTRTDPVVGATSFGYDAFNRRTSVTDLNGVETVTVYDDLDRVTQMTQVGAVPADDLVTAHEYNVFGDLFRTTQPRGNVIEYAYDAAGRLVSIERKPDASTPGERTVYTLDAFGHRTKEELQRWDGAAWVTDSFTDFVYSTRCHLDQVVDAVGSVTEYDYDCDGNLAREWDANHPSAGQTNPATRAYAYDALDRLTSVTEPWGGAGGGNAVTSYGYDVQDHLTSVTDAEGSTTTYAYSDRDLITEEDSPVSGVTTRTYDAHGSLASTTDARTVTVTRTYDAADRVTFVNYPDPALDVTYAYDDPGVSFSQGRLTAITRDGLSVDYEYDRFGRTTQDGELTYAYDENGNRTEIGYPGGEVARYTHDFADREATLEFEPAAGSPETVVASASYYAGGPPSSVELGNGLTETRVQHGVGGTTTFSYDAAGNQTQTNASGVVTDWTYDDASRLSRIERSAPEAHTDFFYDGRSFLRLAEAQGQDISGAAIFCDGFESGDTSVWGSGPGTCIAQQETAPTYASEGAVNARDPAIVLYFAGRPIALIDIGVRYMSVDHLGTPFLLTNASSGVIWEGGFEPFGRDYASAQSEGLFLRHPGQWNDSAWNGYIPGELLYNVHRWYNPELGRYMRPDPIPPGKARSVSLFAYAAANPLRYLDPLGLLLVCCNEWDKQNLQGILNHVADLQDFVITGENDPGPLAISPYGDTVCSGIGYYRGGTPTTTYYNLSPGNCVNACVRVHEQWHRDQCRKRGLFEVLRSADNLDEAIAYAHEAGCLSDAIESGFVDVDVDPLGPDNR